MDGGNGFGGNGWRLSPIGGVKNVAFTNEKFDGQNSETVPENFKQGWR